VGRTAGRLFSARPKPSGISAETLNAMDLGRRVYSNHRVRSCERPW
jgi:hypothetical protein